MKFPFHFYGQDGKKPKCHTLWYWRTIYAESKEAAVEHFRKTDRLDLAEVWVVSFPTTYAQHATKAKSWSAVPKQLVMIDHAVQPKSAQAVIHEDPLSGDDNG